jgi:hypothetical protein
VGLAPAISAQENTPRPQDYSDWNRSTQVVLSDDGLWMAYAHQPNDGDATFFVLELDGDSEYEATNGSDAVFSNDGRWVEFLTSPPEEDADEDLGRDELASRTLHLIDLRAGDRTEDSAVRSFSFSEDSRFLAIHKEQSD